MVTLLNGPDVVTVTPKVKVSGDYGTRLEDGESVRVAGVSVQDFNATYERGADGDVQVSADIVIYGPASNPWPGGPHSTIHVETGGYAGMAFDQQGIPKHYTRSPRTSHWRVLAAVRSTEAR